MQIAFSGAIRVGDVVQLEDGQWWGRIEEITLSYVVVRLWDEPRLVAAVHLLHHRPVRELDPQRHRDHGHRRVRPEADERARAFDHSEEHDDELARTNGGG